MSHTINSENENKVEAMQSEKKNEVLTKRKGGRPSGVEMMDYGKDIIRDANMRRRNEEGQDFMNKLVDIFWAKYKKYPGTLFWLPSQTDSYTATLTFLPEEKYSRSYLPCNVYRLTEVRKPKENNNKLNADLIFERVLFPDSYTYPPRMSFSIVEIIRKMFTASHDTNAYFLNADAYKEFVSEALRASQKYSNSCEPKRLVNNSGQWLRKNIKEHPERFTYNKENQGFIRYRRLFLENLIKTLQDKVFKLKHDLKNMADPGTFGYETRDEAETKLSARIRKIRVMVMERVIQREIESHTAGYINEKELRKRGVALKPSDFDYLPAPVLSEYKWLVEKYNAIHNFNSINAMLNSHQTELAKAQRSLEFVKKQTTKTISDPDGLGEAQKYWDWYKGKLEDRRKVNETLPENMEDPMALRSAALLFAGELRSQKAHKENNDDIEPLMRIEYER